MLVPGLKKRSRICFEYFCTYRVAYCVLSFMCIDIFRDLTLAFDLSNMKHFVNKYRIFKIQNSFFSLDLVYCTKETKLGDGQ